MAEVLPGIHTIDGIDPSSDFTTHVYLVRDKGDRWTLLDTGLPGSDQAIVAYLDRHKIAPTSIGTILITHLHLDHVGNLKRMAELTRARTFAHWIDADFIAKRPSYDGPGVPPQEPFEVSERLKDGDTVDAAGGAVAYHTPGHTPGHTCYYLEERRILFSGDLFMTGNTGPGQELVLTVPEYTHHTPTAQISARRMAGLKVDSVMSYHGGPVLKNGGETIRKIVSRF
jgi:glyoxylase-like metal-dependent hydrolase (beta-lactamase superfamily II)